MTHSEAQKPGSSLWLGDYLDDAIERRLCVKICCTKCGTLEFRQGLYDRAAKKLGLPDSSSKDVYRVTTVVGVPPGYYEDDRILLELIQQLALLNPDPERSLKWFVAVRLIFYEVWWTVGSVTFKCVYQPLVEGTWAGTVLHAMEEHYRREIETKFAVRERQEAKRILKQKALAERIARKKEHDRIWFEQHPKGKDHANLKAQKKSPLCGIMK